MKRGEVKEMYEQYKLLTKFKPCKYTAFWEDLFIRKKSFEEIVKKEYKHGGARHCKGLTEKWKKAVADGYKYTYACYTMHYNSKTLENKFIY